MTASYSGLSSAAANFRTSGRSLDSINEDNKGQRVLIPLTSSMYVPGKLSDVSKVMVDVGTGYFVQKSIEDAKVFFEKKEAYIREQSKKVEEQLETKQDQHAQVRRAAQIAQARAQQAQQQAAQQQ